MSPFSTYFPPDFHSLSTSRSIFFFQKIFLRKKKREREKEIDPWRKKSRRRRRRKKKRNEKTIPEGARCSTHPSSRCGDLTVGRGLVDDEIRVCRISDNGATVERGVRRVPDEKLQRSTYWVRRVNAAEVILDGKCRPLMISCQSFLLITSTRPPLAITKLYNSYRSSTDFAMIGSRLIGVPEIKIIKQVGGR